MSEKLNITRRTFVAATGATAVALSTGLPARAAETIEVKMLNKNDAGERFVYEPAFIKANVGDTIKFVSVDKGHNAASVVLPEGIEKFKSKASQDFEFVVSEEGSYSIVCTPHAAVGMVALVVVGDYTKNIEDVKGGKYVGKSKAKIAELIKMAEESA